MAQTDNEIPCTNGKPTQAKQQNKKRHKNLQLHNYYGPI